MTSVNTIAILLLVILTVLTVTGKDYIQCRSCNNAVDLSECTYQASCDKTIEDCYMDAMITPQLTKLYSSGCRSKQKVVKPMWTTYLQYTWRQDYNVCDVMLSLGKKRNLVECARCCNDTDDCNTRLCGITGDIPTTMSTTLRTQVPFMPLQCRFCQRAKDLSECTTFDTCDAATEFCFMDELITDRLTIVYSGGCRSKQVCLGNGRKKRDSDIVACSKCCDHEKCNEHYCGIKNGPSYYCNVDDSCDWKQSLTDSIDWHEMRGPTQSGDTGPDYDHSHGNVNGTYYYIEASSPSKQGDFADLVSPPLSTNMSRCLEFWYSVYGYDIGTLNVTVQSIGENTLTLLSISGNQGPGWKKSTTTIPEVPYFYNIVITGSVGPSYHGDIAIDDIVITAGQCQGSSGSQLIIG